MNDKKIYTFSSVFNLYKKTKNLETHTTDHFRIDLHKNKAQTDQILSTFGTGQYTVIQFFYYFYCHFKCMKDFMCKLIDEYYLCFKCKSLLNVNPSWR